MYDFLWNSEVKIWRGLPGREEAPMMTGFEDGGKGCPRVEFGEVAGVGLRVREGSELPRWIRRRKKRNGLGIDIIRRCGEN